MGFSSLPRAEGSANTSLLSKVGLLFSIDMIAAAIGAYAGRGITSGWTIFFLFLFSLGLLFVVKGLERVDSVLAAGCAAFFAFIVGTWSGPGLAHWHHVLGSTTMITAFLGTSLAMVVFGAIGAFSGRNFSSWWPFLFNALLGLIIVRVIFMFLPSMSATAILSGVAGMLLFSGYFIYDFYKASHDNNNWSTAVDHSINIFLDFLNFLYSLYQVLSGGK